MKARWIVALVALFVAAYYVGWVNASPNESGPEDVPAPWSPATESVPVPFGGGSTDVGSAGA